MKQPNLTKVFTVVAVLLLPQFAVAGTDTSFEFGTAYRADRLDWNIANDLAGTSTPNILSELTWDNLNIMQLDMGMRTEANNIVFRVDADYGWILTGNNQDSDYDGNNRTLESSRSNNDAGAGNVWDVSTAIGYNFGEDASITPLIGWSMHRQNLRLRDGFQTIPATGDFAGLNSKYDAEWTGPWLGFDAGVTTENAARFFLNFAYHFATYKAEADWNLRTDFAHPVSFRHEATGYGIDAGGGVEYELAENQMLVAGIEYRKWKADNGADTTFFATGASSVTKLNEVNWQSFTFRLDAAYAF